MQEETDENKVDFDLIKQRRQSQLSTTSSDSTIPSDDSNPSSEVWPLQLTPGFIDHYIKGDLIGSGSYAEVRECVDTRTLERCALKIINKKYLLRQAPRALDNQLQEIRILRHIGHANVISMRECLYKGPFIYIALEYCSFNLNELLNNQPENKLHLVLGRRFFHQLCLGLGHLHSLGIVHRDIKPDNLLLTNAGVLKIIDFGVSQILSMWQRTDWCSNYEGTPLFQAPEVISGQAEYRGFKVDVWSCGVTLFLMLFGSYPFMDEALLALYDKILSQELLVPKQEPASLALTDLLAFMLDKDHQRRASIEQVLAHPWLKLYQTNLHDNDEPIDVGDMLELATASDQRRASSRSQDVYRSMTVLPYLYRFHFPNLPIRKRSRGQALSESTVSGSTCRIERLNSIDSPSASNSTDSRPNRSPAEQAGPMADQTGAAAVLSPLNGPDATRNSPDLANQVEWGTEEQYQLMKVPQVRANRVRASRRRKSRGRNRTASCRGRRRSQRQPSRSG